MLVIGITGQFCSGKTTAAQLFVEFGAKVINADKIGHKALLEKTVRRQLVDYFSVEILDRSGIINRKKLAKRAFSNRRSHKRLCKIVHPILIDLIQNQLKIIKLKNPNQIVIIDAAILIEMGLLRIVDKLIVVETDSTIQIERAKKKWAISERDVKIRIDLQMSLRQLIKKADFVINNNGSLKETRGQVKKIWREIVNCKMDF